MCKRRSEKSDIFKARRRYLLQLKENIDDWMNEGEKGVTMQMNQRNLQQNLTSDVQVNRQTRRQTSRQLSRQVSKQVSVEKI